MLKWIPEEHTRRGSGGELVRCKMSEIGETKTPKHPHVIIGRMATVEKVERSEVVHRRRGAPIDQMIGGMESLDPIFWRHLGVDEESA